MIRIGEQIEDELSGVPFSGPGFAGFCKGLECLNHRQSINKEYGVLRMQRYPSQIEVPLCEAPTLMNRSRSKALQLDLSF